MGGLLSTGPTPSSFTYDGHVLLQRHLCTQKNCLASKTIRSLAGLMFKGSGIINNTESEYTETLR